MNSKVKKCSTLFLMTLWMLKNCSYSFGTEETVYINVLFINSENNKVATDGVQNAVRHIQEDPDYRIQINLMTTIGNSSDERDFLEQVCENYEESILNSTAPHIILDTTKSLSLSRVVRSFTKALALPTISSSFGRQEDLKTWINLIKGQDAYLLHIMPPGELIPLIVRGLVIKMNLQDAAVLYDETFIMDHKNKHLLHNLTTKHIISPVTNESPRARLLQINQLLRFNINNFFILGKMETIRKYLESVEPNDVPQSLAWFAITTDSSTLGSTNIRNFFNFILLQPRVHPEKLRKLNILPNDFNGEHYLIELAFYFDLSVRTFFATREYLRKGGWLSETMDYLLCNDFNGNNTPARDIKLRKLFTEVKVPESFGSFHFVKNPNAAFNGATFMNFVMDLFVVKMNGSMVMAKDLYGNWTAGFKSSIVANETDIERLASETVYRIYVVEIPPFVIRDENEPKGYKGFCIDLINLISQEYNFDYVIYEETKFGNMDENGTWTGVVRKLVDREADIGLGAMSVMAERETVIDFTVPFYDLVGISVMMLKPTVPTSLFKFLNVLETNVWFCILAAFFFTSFLMWVFDRWSPYSYQNNKEKYKDDDEKREFNFKECLWFCTTSLTPQGGGEAPKSLSGRLLAATWWLFGFIIMSSYTANLAAFLTVSRLESPIDSFDDLIKQYKILYAPINGSGSMFFFERMAAIETYFYGVWKNKALNDSLSTLERAKLAVWDYPISDKYTKIWNSMRETGFPNTIEEALERVRNSTSASGFAYIGEAIDIRYMTINNCDLKMVGEEFAKKPFAIAVQQGSHLRDQFNAIILKLLNQRSIEMLKDKWWTNDALKCEADKDPSDGIDFDNIGGVFLVIFLGIGFALIVLIIEYWYFKCYESRQVSALQSSSDNVEIITYHSSLDFKNQKQIKY